ncbi:MAG: hypothetical protein R8P61_19645 [Bacteroidia bacterium]|nr:hypothetical protein [Bacteroidia bacterium]
MRTIILSLFLFLLTSLQLSAQLWTLGQKLGTADQWGGDNLGISVAISDSFMITGAWWADYDENGGARISEAGSAYIYKLQANGDWQEIQKLVSPERQRLGYYGFSVDIEGDLALVGAFNESLGSSGAAGKAYVYRRESNDIWVLEDTLKSLNPLNGDFLGKSLSLSGDYALLGSPGNDTDENGANPMPEAGAAYIFKRAANQSWTQLVKLVAEDRANGDEFGSVVALDNYALMIGAPPKDADQLSLATGIAYGTYFETESEFEQMTLADLQRIEASDSDFFDSFGSGLALDGEWAVIGAARAESDLATTLGRANGAAYFFKWENDSWVEKQKVFPSNPDFSGSFGSSIDMEGSAAIIGAGTAACDRNQSNLISAAGAAHVFELDGNGQWSEKAKLAGTERSDSDLFGAAVSISQDFVMVGAWGADTVNGETKPAMGAIYTFERAWPLARENELQLDQIEFSYDRNSHLISIGNQSLEKRKYLMQIIGLDGKLIWEESAEWLDNWEKDVSVLPAGFYVFRLQKEGFLPFYRKWIKE